MSSPALRLAGSACLRVPVCNAFLPCPALPPKVSSPVEAQDILPLLSVFGRLDDMLLEVWLPFPTVTGKASQSNRQSVVGRQPAGPGLLPPVTLKPIRSLDLRSRWRPRRKPRDSGRDAGSYKNPRLDGKTAAPSAVESRQVRAFGPFPPGEVAE